MANLTAENDIQMIDNKATILGTAEADEILATQTNDHLMLSILAGAGDDIVLVNSGNNEVYGEEGNDLFSILTIGNHTVDGGNGQDTVRLWSVDPYSLSSYLNDNGVITLSSNFATHTFTNVEVFTFYFTSPYPYIDRVLSVAELDAFYDASV
jgi:Ca2+-binding RTX toxin-like protein